MADSYEAWRITYQSSEQAARAAFAEMQRLAAALEAAREDAWRPIEFEPPHNRKKDSFGTEYLIHPPTSGGDRTAFYGRRLGGAACWYRYGAPVRGVTHWRPLPTPPAIDQARGKGGGEVEGG